MIRPAQDIVKKLNAAFALHQKGDLPGAEALYREVLRLDPQQADALHYLGFLAHQVGRGNDALALMQRAVLLSPRNPVYHSNLAEVYRALGKLPAAEQSYREVLRLSPSDPGAHFNLANILSGGGRPGEAIEHFQHALKLRPDYTDAYNNLAHAYGMLGRYDEAIACLKTVLKLDPGRADANNNLGIALEEQGKAKLALEYFRAAVRLQPDYAEAYSNLGNAYRDLGDLDEAEKNYRQALALNPNLAEACNNLGGVLGGRGAIDEALNAYLRALEIKPDYLDAKRAYLTTWLYRPDATVEDSFEQHSAFEARFCSALRAIDRPFTQSRHPLKKLRIGYVSSDFRNHPVGRNIMPLIGRHDRSKYEVYLYGNVKRPDSITEWFKNASEGWRSIAGMTDRAAAEMIRQDEIDILVLLAGRFDDNRPLIAAYRAAPVQVSFHDPATSGLQAMDYLMTDHVLSPRQTRERFTERLVHLPTFYLHAPMINVPEVSPLPARERGYVSFGSFNNLAKVNDQVAALWSRVLHAVPNSRLILKYQNIFGNARVRQRYLDLFGAYGIEAHRLDLVSASDTGEQHLARYGAIDIALDPFPFTGSTTTFEALWMGVPVITLPRETMVSRWSMAMLKKIQLDDLIARNEDEYVAAAQQLTGNLERLAQLRATLRERVANSPLCDERARARQIERTYRWMWQKWCATEKRPPSPGPLPQAGEEK